MTQLYQLPDSLKKVTEYLSGDSGEPFHGSRIVLAIVIYFFIAGFLAGYLLTRLFLANAFSRADSLQNSIEQIFKKAPDILGLSTAAKDKLKEVVSRHNKKEDPVKLPVDFVREGPEHQIFRELRKRFIIQPRAQNSWQAGTIVDLTPIALQSIGEITTALELDDKSATPK